MSYKGSQSSEVLTFGLIVAVIGATLVWKLHKLTGLSPEAITGAAGNLAFLAFAVVGAIWLQWIRPSQSWSYILAALWLCLTPMLNELGAGYTEESFGRYVTVVEPSWIAQSHWQITVAIALASLKHVCDWGYDWARSCR